MLYSTSANLDILRHWREQTRKYCHIAPKWVSRSLVMLLRRSAPSDSRACIIIIVIMMTWRTVDRLVHTACASQYDMLLCPFLFRWYQRYPIMTIMLLLLYKRNFLYLQKIFVNMFIGCVYYDQNSKNCYSLTKQNIEKVWPI